MAKRIRVKQGEKRGLWMVANERHRGEFELEVLDRREVGERKPLVHFRHPVTRRVALGGGEGGR